MRCIPMTNVACNHQSIVCSEVVGEPLSSILERAGTTRGRGWAGAPRYCGMGPDDQPIATASASTIVRGPGNTSSPAAIGKSGIRFLCDAGALYARTAQGGYSRALG